MNKIFILIILLISYSLSSVTILSGDGKETNRLRVIMVGDGYTASEETKFVEDAKDILSTMKQETFYSQFDGAINFYAVFTPSAESGADHPLQGIYVNTAFDATFGSTSSLERLVTVNSSKVKNFLLTVFSNYDPNYDITLVVVNDQQYGGSGGQIATTTINSSGPLIAIHEIGHSFGKLTDEYDYQNEYQPGEFPNSTAITEKSLVKWNVWFDDTTPIPTPETSAYNEVVGLFEGACYRPTGWYRPYNNCAMKALGNPLCPVCTEELVTNSYKQISPIDSVIPSSSVTVKSDIYDKIIVKTLPLADPPKVYWYVNGILKNIVSDTLNFAEAGFQTGMNTVTAVVRDNSGLVRIASHLRYASDTVTWNVDYTNTEIVKNLDIYKSLIKLNYDNNNFIFRTPVAGNFLLTVSDIKGRTVFSKTLSAVKGLNRVSLESAEISDGVMIVTLHSERVLYRKFMIVK